ncbi:hypothetical protein T265_01828 [Opisthorchis viverrini]|uniref:Uncharacterized protein n=2 Tax=Opisthorchis viverrini TaxID=6198 RepID=A0A075A8J6_OPIVI|nr:hypothetical protein T265_01828 [Opisthorchis viverrini]KER32050.1 hypothetical protein T265_01828 [Opisthorchis viverrini]
MDQGCTIYYGKDACESVMALKPSYWGSKRFRSCTVVANEGGAITFHAIVDSRMLQKDHQKLSTPYMLWVLNRQLNLDSEGCRTLAATLIQDYTSTHLQMPSVSAFTVAGTNKEDFCENIKNRVFLGRVRIYSCHYVGSYEKPLHTELVRLSVITLTEPITRPWFVRLLNELNTGFPRCRYNLMPYVCQPNTPGCQTRAS